MHGEIKVHSRLNEGSSFSFTATFETPSPELLDKQIIPKQQISRGFSAIYHSVDVILVESNPFAREILRNLLAAQQIKPLEIVTPWPCRLV